MTTINEQIESRRARLGISKTDVARRSGVSLPTVQRLFTGRGARPGLTTVAKVADVLGVEVRLSGRSRVHEIHSVEAFREMQARKKARRLVRLVHGNMALEAETLDEGVLVAMETESVRTLLAGPPRRLWCE